MPKQQRFKTKYPGVYFIDGTGANGRPEKIFYIQYRKQGKLIEEKAGRQFQDDMTPARASALRADRIQGRELSNEERRKEDRNFQERWTVVRIWEEYKATKPEVKAIKKDEDRFRRYLMNTVGEKEPREIVPLDVDRLRLNLLKTLRPATVRNALELFRRIVNFGVKKHLCDGLRFSIQMPKVNNLRTEDLSPEELSRLLQAIDDDENHQVADIMRMALYTGMRKGEIFKLQWQDIDTERGFIHIRDPKGGPDQVIPLNDAARGVLDCHPKTAGTDYVFPGRDLQARRNVHRVVNRIKDRAGLPQDFRPLHGLRHVYASILASSGEVDLFTLQKLLTHKSSSMTQRYAHLRDETLRKASALAGQLVNRVRLCDDASGRGEATAEQKSL